MPHQEVFRNGKRLTSVTEIPAVVSKVFLDKWRIKLCHCSTHATAKKSKFKEKEKEAVARLGMGHCGFVYGDAIKDDAAELGTEIHALIDGWLQGKEGQVVSIPDAGIWTNRIVDLYREHGVKLIDPGSEVQLIDEESGLNGCIDHTITYDGTACLADLKIKNQLDDFTGVQGWLYRYLIRRIHNKDFRYMLVVWGKKESRDYEVEPVLIDLDEWGEVSKACVTIWNRLNKTHEVKIIE